MRVVERHVERRARVAARARAGMGTVEGRAASGRGPGDREGDCDERQEGSSTHVNTDARAASRLGEDDA
jgi:hypothetical protein